MSAARIVAVNWVALTNVVVRAIPLMRTEEPATKFVPFTVRVVARPPAAIVAGTSGAVIVGIGTLVTVKLTALEVPPPGAGFRTVIGKVPTATMSVAGIIAVN